MIRTDPNKGCYNLVLANVASLASRRSDEGSEGGGNGYGRGGVGEEDV